MRILVCGGREYDDYDTVNFILNAFIAGREVDPTDVTIIQGGANGVDTLAARWANDNNTTLFTEKALWKTYGKAAGAVRNQRMLDRWTPEVCIAFPGGAGTADMVKRSLAAGLEVYKVKRNREMVRVFATVEEE